MGLLLLEASPASAASSFFRVTCNYDHTLMEDPIVFPGQAEAGHSHDFFATRSTGADSTTSSMLAGATTCSKSADTSGYWVPSMYLSGVQVMPVKVAAYYMRPRGITGPLTPFHAGFQMVAGNSHATSEQPMKVVSWGCGFASGIVGLKSPPNCTGLADGHLVVHVVFPWCWDGTLTGGNDTAHVVYGTASGCPDGTMAFPRLVEAVHYNIADATNVTLASGPYYTLHGDYFSAWQPGVLEQFVAGI
jgi:hypothetical protein